MAMPTDEQLTIRIRQIAKEHGIEDLSAYQMEYLRSIYVTGYYRGLDSDQ